MITPIATGRGTRPLANRMNRFTGPGTMTALPASRPRSAARATCSGYWQVRRPASPCRAISSRAPRFVRMPFGQTTLTETPVPRSSSRSARLKASTKLFDEEYTGSQGMGKNAARLATFSTCARPLPAQRGEQQAREGDDGEHVQPDRRLVVRGLRLAEPAVEADAGIVDERVDREAVLFHEPGQARGAVVGGEVDLEGVDAHAVDALDPPGHLEQARVGQRGEHERAAPDGALLREGLAQALARSGDDGEGFAVHAPFRCGSPRITSTTCVK